MRAKLKIAAKSIVIALLLASLVLPFPACMDSSSGEAQGAAAVAKQEYETYAGLSGEKYWSWYGYSSREEWCACFASWCADQAGLIEQGLAPKHSGVVGWIQFYRDNPEAGSLESGDTYTPVSGDFIIWQRSEDPDALMTSHIGIVEYFDDETGTVHTLEGNSGDAIARNSYKAGEGISFYCHPASAGDTTLSGCSSTSLGGGETIQVPSGLGKVHTYMGWQTITSPSSAQYRLREEAGESYDSEGFAKIGSRYVIACTTTFGAVGDYVDFEQADGSVIECIIGDIKSQGDPGCNEWGHLDGTCIIEFVVNKSTWYGTGHANPGTAGCHPEWSQEIVKAVNHGSWFDGDKPSSQSSPLKACSAVMRGQASTSGLEGSEGKAADWLMSKGLDRTHAAAVIAVAEATGATNGNLSAAVKDVWSSFKRWAQPKQAEFETISEAGQAAEHLGRYCLGLDEETTEWGTLRERAAELKRAMD